MDYRDIGHVSRGFFDAGRLKVQNDGLYFKSLKSGKVFQVAADDIDTMEWMHAARGYEVKVIAKEGEVTKFSGFKDGDYVELKNFIKSHYNKDLCSIDISVKGWNWGEPNFRGSLMSFNVDRKPAFEVPLNEVSLVTSGKNEVVMEFHMNEDSPLSLVEMRFHVPAAAAPQVLEEVDEGAELGPDPVKELHDKIMAKADVIQAIGDAIVTFPETHCLTPRGRYSFKIYPSFIQLHGKTFDYKIPHKSVLRMFLLPHNDQRQMFFAIQLDPPLRQGQTRYHFVILLMTITDERDIVLSLTDEEIEERYGKDTKVHQKMSGAFYQLFSRVMKVLVGKKVTIPGAFKIKNNESAINCSNKATSGYLYPLDRGFIFVHKPVIYIKFDGISSVNFARMTGGAGVSKSFDFELEMKDGSAYHFSSIMKDDFDRLSQFVSEKNLRVKNKGKIPEHAHKYHDDGSSESDHDAYLARMKAEGEDRDSEDEDSDFVAANSGSEDDIDFDSDAKVSDDSEKESMNERASHDRGKKRKKHSPKSAKPSKKAKPSEASSRRKGSKKDPNAPKRPLSGYMLWLQDNREDIKRKHPGISVTEVSKRAGVQWKSLASIDKTKYEEKAKKCRKQYQKDMTEYKASEGYSTVSRSPTATKKGKPHARGKKPSSVAASSKLMKSAEIVPSDEDASSAESSQSDTSEEEETKGISSGLRSGGGDDKFVSLASDREDEEDASDSGDDSSSEAED